MSQAKPKLELDHIQERAMALDVLGLSKRAIGAKIGRDPSTIGRWRALPGWYEERRARAAEITERLQRCVVGTAIDANETLSELRLSGRRGDTTRLGAACKQVESGLRIALKSLDLEESQTPSQADVRVYFGLPEEADDEGGDGSSEGGGS